MRRESADATHLATESGSASSQETRFSPSKPEIKVKVGEANFKELNQAMMEQATMLRLSRLAKGRKLVELIGTAVSF